MKSEVRKAKSEIARNMTVVVTGGTKGIGLAIAQRFYKDGAHVIIGARSDNGVSKRLGERTRFIKADAANRGDHLALAGWATRWTGHLDSYINCAGFCEWRPIEDVDEDFLDRMTAVNLKGVLWGCKAASACMKEGGSIINVSSLAGKRGSSNNSVYCAAKFGVNGITQALAKELGPRGIRVNSVCPVYVETEGVLEALRDKNSPASGRNVKKYLKEFIESSCALRRLPTVQEVADVVFFLASPAANAITGQCINVDCGVMPQ